MNYSIDELYDLIMWDRQLSAEENEAKAQTGIDAARKIRNLYPFIQPIVVPPENSKSVWDPCAKIVAMRSDEELKPYLFMLLEWIQDTNWPGAMIIYDRLLRMPYSLLEFAYTYSRKKAQQTNDTCWLDVLDQLYEDLEAKSQNLRLSASVKEK